MTETLIAVMGATGTGKTTFINLVSGSNLAIGEGLKLCTLTVQTSKTFWFEGRKVSMLDTPGRYLAASYQRKQKLAGIIYMHRISDVRVGGVSRRNFSMFRTLCGDATLRAVVLVTNMWGAAGEERGAARERELAADPLLFQPDVLRLLVGGAPAVLQIQDELVDQHRALEQTSTGVELNRELQKREEQARVEREQARRAAEEEAARAAAAHARWVAEQEAERCAAEQRARNAEARLQEEAGLAREREAEVRRLRAEAERTAQQWAAEQERLRHERERVAHMRRRRNDCIIC
ncbi:hypothetical protein B0H21DRAFT_823242 [Amylocystis lapponica]|nr:hypothetical protein B0H21DRAFT_823242 [Amylocystis lapponica]